MLHRDAMVGGVGFRRGAILLQALGVLTGGSGPTADSCPDRVKKQRAGLRGS